MKQQVGTWVYGFIVGMVLMYFVMHWAVSQLCGG